MENLSFIPKTEVITKYSRQQVKSFKICWTELFVLPPCTEAQKWNFVKTIEYYL